MCVEVSLSIPKNSRSVSVNDGVSQINELMKTNVHNDLNIFFVLLTKILFYKKNLTKSTNLVDCLQSLSF